MFLKYANSHNDMPDGYMNKNVPLEINSCGTYKLDTENELETCRPNGRTDYQLIYIASGKGYFFFDHSKEPTILEAGNIVLYHPGEFQKYEYHGTDHAHIYWIHFTGNKIPTLFEKYALNPSDTVFPVGTNSFYARTFDQIISELRLKREFHAESVGILFSYIIMTVGRYNHELSHERQVLPENFEEITLFLHEHYMENIRFDSLIKDRGYSMSSFFRKFRQYTGMTPLQYLLDIRLTNSMKLLETTDFSVHEIAALVGYDNALYFSRLFHQHMGVSPKEYRAALRKKAP